MRMRILPGTLTALLFLAAGAWSQLSETEIGIDEHLGATIPLDATFYDEAGRVVRLGDLIDRPTALALVYFSCPGICSPLLDGVAEVVGRSQLRPGQDYRVIAISFDLNDTPAAAEDEEEQARRQATQSAKRKNYLAAVGRSVPEEGWRFLTGDAENIDRITSAVGFKYKRQGNELIHSGALTILSPRARSRAISTASPSCPSIWRWPSRRPRRARWARPSTNCCATASATIRWARPTSCR